MAWQLASVAAIVVSYLVAVQFRDVLSERIDAEPPWNTFLAMLILYIGTSFVIWLVFQFVRGFIDRAKLREFDRQMGAIFGLAKGVLLCVIITLFAVTLSSDDQRQQIIDSRSGLYIAKLLDRADAVMPEELHDFLHPYLNRFDGQPGLPAKGSEIDDFRRLEDWLESGQGGARWGGSERSARHGFSARVGGHLAPASPPYRAEIDPLRRDYDATPRR